MMDCDKISNMNDDYTLDKKHIIGEGSFSTVYMGKKISTGKQLCVKVIEKKNVPQNFRHSIEGESNIISSLNHPNIITLEHTLEDDNNVYIFMPYYKGGDLHSFIEECNFISEKVAFRIFAQLVDAIEHCHVNNVIHMDIKLENMLIDNCKDLNIILIDFGFSMIRKPTDPLIQIFPGSPAYAAPELVDQVPNLGYPSDVWSMGIVLYICVTGDYPFWSADRKELYRQIMWNSLDFSQCPHLSYSCIDLLTGMLNKDSENRFTLQQIKNHSWFRERKWMTKANETLSDVTLSHSRTV